MATDPRILAAAHLRVAAHHLTEAGEALQTAIARLGPVATDEEPLLAEIAGALGGATGIPPFADGLTMIARTLDDDTAGDTRSTSAEDRRAREDADREARHPAMPPTPEELAAHAARGCVNPAHDHAGVDDSGAATGEPMVCADCGAPTHYDYRVEAYVHDEPAAQPCFLIRERPTGATPCGEG